MQTNRFATLRNTNRTTPWNLTTRAIGHEIDNLAALVAAGVANRGDHDRIADLEDELARRAQDVV